MFDLTVTQLESLLGGRLRIGQPPPLDGPHLPLGRVVLDSRRVTRGDVYWALEGLPGSGHERAEEALDRGAMGIVATRRVPPWAGCWTLQVDDSKAALVRLVTEVPSRESFARKVHGQHTVLDVSRYASPDMLTTALFELRGTHAVGRRAIVCGDLCSPRWDSGDLHAHWGLQAAAVGDAEYLIACGRFSREVATGAREGGLSATAVVACRSVSEGIAELRTRLTSGDTLLVVGSRHLAMSPVVRMVLTSHHAPLAA